MTELQSLSKLKKAGKLRYRRGTIEVPESELHSICDEIQAEHDRAIAATLGSGTCRDKNGFDESMGFECTVCETTVDSYMQTTTDSKPEQFRFCPNCRRRVER